MKKIILYLSLICVVVLQFNIDIFADDVFDLSNYVSVSDLPDNELDSLGRVITGSLITHNSQNSNNYFNYTTWDDSSSAGFIYVTRDSGNYGYNYNYHIYLNGDFYSSTPTAFKCYTKTFTDSEISSSGDVETLLDNVVDDPNYSWNYPSAHYAFYADDIITNIPMFTHGDTNAINAYLQNGDYSGALNSNDIVKKPVVPQPYFDKVNGLDDTSKRQRIANGFSSNLIFKWNTGSNNTFTYENMGYEGTLSVVVNYLDSGTLTSETVTENVSYTAYEGSSPYYIFNSDVLNKKIFTLFGVDFFGSLGGRIVKATFQIRNVASDDRDNKSAPVYFAYNFIDGTSGTNNDSNNNADSTEESTEDITYNPNTNQSGNGEVPSNSSSSSSATANGVVVNVTQNNTNGKSSIWDTVLNALNIVLNVFGNKLGDLFDDGSDLLKALTSIASNVDLTIPDVFGNFADYLNALSGFYGGNSSSGGTSSGGLGGLAGAIESITGFINNLISGVLTPFTDAITSLMDSVSDLLSASSELGQYITSGFGLLGENGYIAMFGSFFQFVPTEIWSLIKLAVGSSCSVLLSGSIVKLLRRN